MSFQCSSWTHRFKIEAWDFPLFRSGRSGRIPGADWGRSWMRLKPSSAVEIRGETTRRLECSKDWNLIRWKEEHSNAASSHVSFSLSLRLCFPPLTFSLLTMNLFICENVKTFSLNFCLFFSAVFVLKNPVCLGDDLSDAQTFNQMNEKRKNKLYEGNLPCYWTSAASEQNTK